MDWKECFARKFVKETKTDKNIINSLIKTSKDKIYSNNKLELDEFTAGTKITIIYDSLREILEALAIKRGFKIYNHECFSSFLDEICKKKSYSLEFDKFRKIRNQINYYGKNIVPGEAKTIIKEMLELRGQILNEYF